MRLKSCNPMDIPLSILLTLWDVSFADHAKEARYLLLAASGTLDPQWRRRRTGGGIVSDAERMRGRQD